MGTGLTGIGKTMGPKMHSTAVISAVTVIWVVVIFSFFSEADLSIIQTLLFPFSSGLPRPGRFIPGLLSTSYIFVFTL